MSGFILSLITNKSFSELYMAQYVLLIMSLNVRVHFIFDDKQIILRIVYGTICITNNELKRLGSTSTIGFSLFLLLDKLSVPGSPIIILDYVLYIISSCFLLYAASRNTIKNIYFISQCIVYCNSKL